MIDAGDAGATAQVVALDETLDLGHLVDQLDGEAERVLARTASPSPGVMPGRDPPHRAAADAPYQAERPGRGRRACALRKPDAPARAGRGRCRRIRLWWTSSSYPRR